ncbi:hypothetical protein T440DRAFT_80710 [Plenodomus tracheiphilus IPT5]|uniref:Uncharacterized protein n=1 Tax=Plenodomus tracheiphilus IPT5 TaxID=1408161 RepID=A0A6A7B8Q4_9PLEO|nr:hypothetical protein T440DRAFT_80710 [Plenodomus tracheiphilus IPT5]
MMSTVLTKGGIAICHHRGLVTIRPDISIRLQDPHGPMVNNTQYYPSKCTTFQSFLHPLLYTLIQSSKNQRQHLSSINFPRRIHHQSPHPNSLHDHPHTHSRRILHSAPSMQRPQLLYQHRNELSVLLWTYNMGVSGVQLCGT